MATGAFILAGTAALFQTGVERLERWGLRHGGEQVGPGILDQGLDLTFVVAGTALGQIRERFAFVDAELLPIVSDGRGRIVIWAFAGTAAAASIAAGLAAQGLTVLAFDDLSVTLQDRDLEHAANALHRINPVSIRPKLPEDLETSLKFGLCLPTEVIASVLKARTTDPAAVAATCRRKLRQISTHEAG